MPYEKAALPRLTEALPDLSIVPVAPSLVLRSLDQALFDQDSDGHDHPHDGLDPHWWLDPRNAVEYCSLVTQTLAELDPEHADIYEQNLAVLSDSLKRLGEEIDSLLEPLDGTALYVFHPAWGYFTDAFGLRQVPIETAGKSPGPRQLAAFVERSRRDNAQVILVQHQFSTATARVFADEIGAEVISADPLAFDYADNLRSLAHLLVEKHKGTQADREAGTL
jgi:zinc transport system substrate-binding protein